jgi:hypothetical protein
VLDYDDHIGQPERMSVNDDDAFAERFTTMLRREVRQWWEQSGRASGKAEPPPPTAVVTYRGDRGHGGLAVTTEQYPELWWYFPWDGTDEAALTDWIETAAEEYWAEYVERNG